MKRLWPILVSQLLLANISPSSLKVQVFAAYLSTSATCTNLTQIFESRNPELRDLFISPILGTADNSNKTLNGSYRCLVIKMSERFYFVPASSTLGCTAGTTYTTDICPNGLTVTGVDGATITCGSEEDMVYLYLSTSSTGTTYVAGINPFAPPTATVLTNGLNLGSIFTVSGGAQARFVINASDSISSTGIGNCRLTFPAISFVRE